MPAAGSIQGANGTFFRSDISITNLRGVPQTVELQWLPQNRNRVIGNYVTMPPNSTVSSDDFVADLLRDTGLGTVIVTAVTQALQPDTSGRLHVTSRIWSLQPGTEGTVSQSLPSVPLADIRSGRQTILGLHHGPQFRTNVGIVNLDSATQRFRVIVSGSVQTVAPVVFDVEIRGTSMTQLPVQWPDDPLIRIDIEALTPASGTRPTLWTAYASNVDQVTGDSYSFLAVETGL